LKEKKIETITLDNGIRVTRKDNKHYLSYEFNDTSGKFFTIKIGKYEIGTDFITPEMKQMGFRTCTAEEIERQHRGSIVHLLKIPQGSNPIPDAFIKYEDLVMTCIRSAGATSYTFKEIACKTMAHESHIISKTDDTRIIESSIKIIEEQLIGIKEGWELADNII